MAALYPPDQDQHGTLRGHGAPLASLADQYHIGWLYADIDTGDLYVALLGRWALLAPGASYEVKMTIGGPAQFGLSTTIAPISGIDDVLMGYLLANSVDFGDDSVVIRNISTVITYQYNNVGEASYPVVFTMPGDVPTLSLAVASDSGGSATIDSIDFSATSPAVLSKVIFLLVSDAGNPLMLSTFDASIFPNVVYLNLNGNALTLSAVNSILHELVASDKSNGLVDVAGGTSAAPSGQGVTDAATLVSRGWTVTTN